MNGETPTEFWEAVRVAAHIPMNPSRFKTVIRRKKKEDEEEGAKNERKGLSPYRRIRS